MIEGLEVASLSPAQASEAGPSRTVHQASVSSLGKRKVNEHTPGNPRANKLAKLDAILTEPAYELLVPDGPESSPVVIAYCPSSELRALIEELPWGSQWEIARFISHGGSFNAFTKASLSSWIDMGTNMAIVPHLLPALRGHAEGSTEDSFARFFEAEKAAIAPWRELDREEATMQNNPYGGLGCNSEHPVSDEVDPDWYGGKVHFPAVLQRHGSSFRIALEAPQLRSSCRFARRFGSKCFMRVRMPDNLFFTEDGSKIQEFFLRPFIIHDSVFRAFRADDRTVFLLRTGYLHNGKEDVCSHSAEVWGVVSLWNFLDWHNKLENNRNQTMMKWAARFHLGLSNSIPGIRLESHQLRHEPDIVTPSFEGTGKVESELVMTDGCGFISGDLLRKLQSILRWQDIPTAVQYRIAGAKGILLLHPDGHDDGSTSDSQIWLRPSQVKIRYCDQNLPNKYFTERPDPALLTLDVLRASRMSSPSRLSTETIINMAENGVPPAIFIKLVTDSMQNRVTSLTTWEGKGAMYQLWANVCRKSAVPSQRLARMLPNLARVKGFVNEDTEQAAEEEDTTSTDDAFVERSVAWWPDAISGCPSTLEETVMTLLDSGFFPQECPLLRDKLHKIIDSSIDNYLKKYHFEVPMSCTAFVVPDPYGILAAGQIHMKSSHKNLINQRGELTDIIRGEVLVTRHPCKIPTDVQKVEAIYHEKLRDYVDVVVVSTQGHLFKGDVYPRSLASMTGGGDYDGDTFTVYWQPDMVHDFRNAEPRWADPPESVEPDLVTDKTTVDEFLQKTAIMDTVQRTREVQRYLLASLRNTTALGKYSRMWENSIYLNGYFHTETRRLAHLFCAVLDGSKTGKSVNGNAFDRDRAEFLRGEMNWKVAHMDYERDNPVKVLERKPGLPKFIMDEIREVVVAETARHKGEVNQLLSRYEREDQELPLDEHLALPWYDAMQRAKQLKEKGFDLPLLELEEVRKHVEVVYAAWDKENRLQYGKKYDGGKSSFTALPIETRQDVLRNWSRRFASKPTGLHDFEYRKNKRVKWSRFPWNCGMRALCEIKAESLERSKTVQESWYARMLVGRVFLDNPC